MWQTWRALAGSWMRLLSPRAMFGINLGLETGRKRFRRYADFARAAKTAWPAMVCSGPLRDGRAVVAVSPRHRLESFDRLRHRRARSGRLVAAASAKRSFRDHSCLEGLRQRHQFSISMTRPEWHPFRVLQYVIEKTAPLRKQVLAELADARRRAAANPKLSLRKPIGSTASRGRPGCSLRAARSVRSPASSAIDDESALPPTPDVLRRRSELTRWAISSHGHLSD